MSYKILLTERFEKELKRLAKKFPSLKEEFGKLIEELLLNPTEGKAIGNNCYKIRLAIRSKGKGKSGGARVITYVYFLKKTVYLITIYDKSEIDTISNAELVELLEGIE